MVSPPDTVEEEEEKDLSGDEGGSHNEYDADQEQGLLSEEAGHVTPPIPTNKEKRQWRGFLIDFGWLIAIVIILGLSFLQVTSRISTRKAAEHDAGTNLGYRRPASDYVLDPDWNIDASSTVRIFNWTILDRVANPDGVYRPMITINGKFPGPMIECNEGDTLIINVENRGINATSIHFHGLFQHGTNWMDGTPGVTQCPIAPKTSFQYKFKVEGQSGTYFYHGHHGVQASDGVFGPLIVHNRNEKKLQQISYQSDRVIMVQDHYHELSSGLLKTSLEPGNEGAPVPDGALINGRNVRQCLEFPDRLCDNIGNEPPIFDLSANGNHRLRFINVGALAWFEISLDEHPLFITEVDGTDVESLEVPQMQIAPAQRYSAVVKTESTAGAAFWLRARIMKHCFKEPDMSDEASIINAAVRIAPDTIKDFVAEPKSSNTGGSYGVTCRDMDHSKFVPIERIPAAIEADHTYYLRSNIEIGDWRLERGVFNSSSFRPNVRSPALHRIIDGLKTGNSSFTTASSSDGVNNLAFDINRELVIQTSGVKTIDLIIQNFDEGNHGMHLHGTKFWVLGQGHAYFPGYEALSTPTSNLASRLASGEVIKRDVASVEGFGWLAIRFVTSNAGIWALHCHMAWHSEAGLAMLILNQPEVMRDWELPDANLALCSAGPGELEKGMPPPDEFWFGSGIGEG